MRQNRTIAALLVVIALLAGVIIGASDVHLPFAEAQSIGTDTPLSYHGAPASGVANVATAVTTGDRYIRWMEVTCSSAGYLSFWDGTNPGDGTGTNLGDFYVAANTPRTIDSQYWSVAGKKITSGNALVCCGPIGSTMSVNVRTSK